MQTALTIEDAILERARALPPDKQQELLDFAEFLSAKALPKQPRKSLKGLWADLGFSVSEEDINEIRREMWKNFPARRHLMAVRSVWP